MNRLLKILGILVLVLALVVIGGITYITQALPDIPLRTDIKVDVTPERVARGEYLANHVCICMDCHSTRDWSLFSGPLTPGTLGVGGELFDQKYGFPGAFVSRNITPHNLKDWTDAEIYRTITSGVSRDGRPFFPVMPYLNYGALNDEDAFSIIAYLRSIPAIASEPTPSKADFPVNIILHTMPKPPQKLDKPSYGQYLAFVSGCTVCHTKHEKGAPVGEMLAGGWSFPVPGGTVTSANLTPHETGIGGWSKEKFIGTFKQYADSAYVLPKVNPGEMQSAMPWTMYAGMTVEDLGAIYDYLRSVKPVDNMVVKWVATK